MKKVFFLCLAILLLIISVRITYAQSTTDLNQCNAITSTNYPTCCPSNFPNIAARCTKYIAAMCAATPSDPLCTPVRGGTQGTNPFGASGDTGNTIGGPSSSTAAASPRSGSIDLAACSAIKFKSALDILIWLKCIILAAVIPLIFSLAFVFFLWGVFKFMTATDVKTRQESQKRIWWGIIGLFVMVSIWGIIQIISNTVGVGDPVVPLLQTEYLK